MDEKQIAVLEYPPYLSDLAPWDFFFSLQSNVSAQEEMFYTTWKCTNGKQMSPYVRKKSYSMALSSRKFRMLGCWSWNGVCLRRKELKCKKLWLQLFFFSRVRLHIIIKRLKLTTPITHTVASEGLYTVRVCLLLFTLGQWCLKVC